MLLMKFFHLGDLHLGKSVYDVNMAKPGGDQEYWIDRFIGKVDEYQPDAVVMAGDIYDRKIPSPEAVVLLNRLLTALTERGKYVLLFREITTLPCAFLSQLTFYRTRRFTSPEN